MLDSLQQVHNMHAVLIIHPGMWFISIYMQPIHTYPKFNVLETVNLTGNAASLTFCQYPLLSFPPSPCNFLFACASSIDFLFGTTLSHQSNQCSLTALTLLSTSTSIPPCVTCPTSVFWRLCLYIHQKKYSHLRFVFCYFFISIFL